MADPVDTTATVIVVAEADWGGSMKLGHPKVTGSSMIAGVVYFEEEQASRSDDVVTGAARTRAGADGASATGVVMLSSFYEQLVVCHYLTTAFLCF